MLLGTNRSQIVALDPGGTGSSGNKIFATIWDGGGANDIYDLSNFTTPVSIDLAPGAFSTIDVNRLATLGGASHMARGNIANALLFGGDARSYIENASGGSDDDTIRGNDTYNTLEGNDGDDILYGFAGGDWLDGGDGDDVLDGGADYDLMLGGTGDDTFYVDYAYDSPVERSGEGSDKVYSSSSFDAPLNLYVEETELTGSGNTYLYGSNTNEKLIGNSGNNRIDGRGGTDVLVGGSGADTFVFSTAPLTANGDSILDFAAAQDKIELSRSVFLGMNAGSMLNASAFVLGTVALDADDRIIYDSTTGYLSYDRDGSGSTYGDIYFASVTAGTGLSANNFTLA